ncbi:hypothetical protein [Streptomyces ossamyceticus]|uniref:hypothetical protein n=1 Tax=Streptomyces ossamyceticus TaxID=249581 RepID=UPI00341C48A7
MNLSGYFADRFGCQVNAENDSNLATLAEHWRGCARHIDDVVTYGRRRMSLMWYAWPVHGLHARADSVG